jgi:hypothetical protein
MSKLIKMQNPRFLALVIVPVLAIALFWAKQGRANAPQGRYIIDELTVTDTKTGLVWQKSVEAAQTNSVDAGIYCQNLPLGGGPWRLPSMKELQTLVDESLKSPAIDPVAFANTPIGAYWSSSVVLPAGFSLWTIDFTDGKTGTLVAFGASAYVRCVR